MSKLLVNYILNNINPSHTMVWCEGITNTSTETSEQLWRAITQIIRKPSESWG